MAGRPDQAKFIDTKDAYTLPVEMNHADWAICRVNGSQNRQDNRVVAPKSDYPRMVLAIERDRVQRLACDRVVTQWRECRTLKEGLMP